MFRRDEGRQKTCPDQCSGSSNRAAADAGEANDSSAFADLMAERDVDPDVMLVGTGYHSDAA